MWPIKPLSRSLLIIFVPLALLSLTGWALAQAASDQAVERSGVSAPQAGVFIDQGTIMLGINDFGQLNVPGGEPSSTNDSTIVGVRYLPTGSEGVGHGNLDEGWGVADALSSVAGWANAFHGVGNLTLHSFTTSASTAQSNASVSSMFSITQDFHPSASPNLYQVDIVITNVTTTTTNLRYRRVIDWDVEPTRWIEYITIDPGNAADLIFTSNDGFAHPNSLTGPSDRGYTGAFVDAGPADYGALFDFNFGNLAPNTAKHFTLYLGAAGTEIEAIVALAKVGAEAYSFAQPSTVDGPTLGTPNTFIMAFTGVGGTPIFSPLTLDPKLANNWSSAGSTVLYTETLINATGFTDTFDLALLNPMWPTTLPFTTTDLLPAGAAQTFTVAVTLPANSADHSDVAQLQATAHTNPALQSNLATLTTAALCDPRLANSGQSDRATSLDDLITYHDQRFAYVSLNAHTTSGSASISATVQGYDPISTTWRTLAQQSFVGPDVTLLDRWFVPSTYTALRVALSDSTGWAQVYYDYQFTVCRRPIVDLQPRAPQHGYAPPNQTQVYTYTLINSTLTTTLFNLAVAGNTWPTTIHTTNGTPIVQTPVLNDREAYTFTVHVATPSGAAPGAWDDAALTATSAGAGTYTDTTTFTTTATCANQIVYTGQSAHAHALDDTYRYHDQAFTYLYLNAHTTSGRNTLNAIVQGYDPVGATWQPLVQQSSVGTDQLLLDRWYAPAAYTAVRVQLSDGWANTSINYDYQWVVCRQPFVDLQPDAPQSRYIAPGQTQVTTYTLVNSTQNTTAFDVNVTGNVWPTTLHNPDGSPLTRTPVFNDLNVYTFTAWVNAPLAALPGSHDVAIIYASAVASPTVQDTVTLTSTAIAGHSGYVMDSVTNRIHVIDTATHIAYNTIDVAAYGAAPLRGALSPDGRWLYATLHGNNFMPDDKLLIIDTTSNTPVMSLTVGTAPHGVAFAPDGTTAFVANSNAGTVSVIDTAAHSVIATLPVGVGAQSIAAQTCLNRAYVTNFGDGTVGVIDLQTRRVIKSITGFNQPWDIVIAPSGARAYVSNQADHSIAVIDPDSNTIVAYWPVTGSWQIAGLDLTPDGTRLYVADATQGVTFILDTDTGSVLNTVPTSNQSSWEVEVFPPDRAPLAYVSNPVGGNVQVINTISNTIVGSIPIGGVPHGLALFPLSARPITCANLTLTKSVTPDRLAQPNQPLHYTLVVTNSAGLTATNVLVTDILSTNVTFGSATTTRGNCNSAVVCQIGTLRLGESAAIEITITPKALGVLTNTATATADQIDPLPGDSTATTSTGIGSANLAVSTSTTPDPVYAGGALRYTVAVTNTGPYTANQVLVSDILSGNLSLSAATPSQGLCSATAPIACELGDLASAFTATVFIDVVPGKAGIITNTAGVNSLQFDPDLSDNVVAQTTSILPGRDLVVTQTAWPNPVPAPGVPVTYTVRIDNTGPFTTTGVTLIDTLPTHADFGSIITNRGSCAAPNPAICDLGEMGPATTATVTLVITPTLVGTYTNQADVSSNDAETDLSNNSATTVVTMGGADLILSKTVWPDPVEVGQPLTYTLIVTSTGPAAATQVVVTDVLPISTQLNSITSSVGACSGTITVLCSLGSLNNGAVAQITLMVTPTASGFIANTARVSADQFDVTPQNNVASIASRVNTSSENLQASNSSPTVLGQTTTLTANVISGNNVYYVWSLGDGAEAITSRVVAHTYPTTGTFTAIVTASNSVSTITATTLVTIDQALAGLSAANTSPTILGQPTAFTATIATGSRVAYAWTFGDGLLGYGATLTRTYVATGTYAAIVTATNSVSTITATTSVVIVVPRYLIYLPLIVRNR